RAGVARGGRAAPLAANQRDLRRRPVQRDAPAVVDHDHLVAAPVVVQLGEGLEAPVELLGPPVRRDDDRAERQPAHPGKWSAPGRTCAERSSSIRYMRDFAWPSPAT